MRMRVIALGDKEFELDAEFAAPAIAAAISGESGEDVRSEIIDWTDAERSDIDRDEYAIVTGDDGRVLWQGWLDSGKDGDPAPASAPRELLDAGDRSQDGRRRELTEERDAALAAPEPDDAMATLRRVEANLDKLRKLVAEILQSMPDTADEPQWRDRAGALGVTDPDGQPYRALTEDDEFTDDPADLADSIADVAPEVLRDILLVVGEDIPAAVIASWTAETRRQVAEYAAREHLAASDNPVTTVERPAILRALPDGTPAWALPVPAEPHGSAGE